MGRAATREACGPAGGAGAKHGNANDRGLPPSRMIMPNYLARALPPPNCHFCRRDAANCCWNINDATQTQGGDAAHRFDACTSAFYVCEKLVSFSLFYLWVAVKSAALIQLPRFIRRTLDGSAERVSRQATWRFFKTLRIMINSHFVTFSCLPAQERKCVEMARRR